MCCTFKMCLRLSSRGAGGAGSVFVRATHRRKTLTLTLPYRLYENEWDAREKCVLFSDGDDRERLSFLRAAAEGLSRDSETLREQIARLEADGREYTVRDALSALCGSRGNCLLGSYADRQASHLERSGRERTGEAYRTAARSLIRYNGGRDIPLARIDAVLMLGYESWLKGNGLMLNTVSFYMRNLRVLLNRAVEEGLAEAPKVNPFAQVFTGIRATKKRALTKEEIRILDRLDFSREDNGVEASGFEAVGSRQEAVGAEQFQAVGSRQSPERASDPAALRQALDVFLFCFHARGMSFVDAAYLKKSDVRDGVLSYTRRKTGQAVEVRLTGVMKELAERFAEATAGSPFLLPLIRRPDEPHRRQYLSALRLQNSRLVRVGALAGLGKRLTTHVSRHSWATVAKGERLPLGVISEGLGHASEKVTRVYLASFDRSALDEAAEKVSEAIKKAC